ncbi:toprim domain-containing protein [Lysobacter arvi]|uniref:Toprim domain-containing protein n=1 Tax=Lysobacter arvi TaxID=3038776 RepID=A0ABU1CB83_9GAMM|nr:toprim domain-containing protein [Lysobacter arvi]MDR0182426.1 toprim domain-containing protein [Lysobacter arvi]
MRPDLLVDITRRLGADYGFKTRGAWLQEGKCPECGKREMYARAEAPWVLRCGRMNRCGVSLHVKDVYAELFASWSDRFIATETNPHAAADAYLQFSRGFPLTRLQGLYTQEYHRDHERGIGSATVRFPLACGGWWERLIDRPERFGKQKARFSYGGHYRGHWWQLPDTDADAREIWLTEGIFDTVALELQGTASRALLSCNNYPEHALAELAKACAAEGRERPALVWALDDGAAGHQYMRRWHERARAEGWESSAAYTPARGRLKPDWNELHQRGELDAKALEQARYHGSLLLAESASEKALLMYAHTERREFHFGFENRLYWFKLDLDRFEKARRALEDADRGLTDKEMREQALRESGGVCEIANCYPTALYYQANRLTDEAWYYFRVSFPHSGRPVKNTFTAAQLASSAEFKKRLLAMAPGAMFTGSTQQLDRIFQRELFAPKVVETLDFIGYSREHRCYVLGDVAVRDGAVHELNDEDYFDIGKLSVKSLNQSLQLSINRDADEYDKGWLDLVWQCYGPKGLIAVAFWFGSLFAEQIRAKQQSYPFLEMSGEPGTGKTTLINHLWKLVGRSGHEGMDPSKSTLVGRTRTFTQVSNLPIVLIESDRDEDTAKGKKFDWDEVKPLFNGHIGRAIGVKNGGNDTYDPPFRGTIVIEQNQPVSASSAVLERIVHMTFDKSRHSLANKDAADRLSSMPIESVSGFILRALRAEASVIATFLRQQPLHERELLRLPDMKNVRLALNHSQVMALLDALHDVQPLTLEQRELTHRELADMAMARQHALNADHPTVVAFWELFEHLDADTTQTSLNHSRDESLIAISLIEMEERAARRGLRLPHHDPSEFKRLLRTSRRRKFIDNKTINSRHTNASKKCWVFRHE